MYVNLGAGTKPMPGYCNVDKLMLPGIDVVADLEDALPFDTETVDGIYAHHVFEHVENIEHLLRECHRILKSKAELVVIVPHFSNPFGYSDCTHRRFWGLYSFEYFSRNQCFGRRVPLYSEANDLFEIRSKMMCFLSPFWVLNKCMKVWQKCVNISARAQMFYEYHLSALVPCYEVKFVLQKPIASSKAEGS